MRSPNRIPFLSKRDGRRTINRDEIEKSVASRDKSQLCYEESCTGRATDYAIPDCTSHQSRYLIAFLSLSPSVSFFHSLETRASRVRKKHPVKRNPVALCARQSDIDVAFNNFPGEQQEIDRTQAGLLEIFRNLLRA